MPQRLTSEELWRIERKIRDGKSLRELADEEQLSIHTLVEIRDGRHELQVNPTHKRCPGCGGQQTDPCLVCRTRRDVDDRKTVERFNPRGPAHPQPGLFEVRGALGLAFYPRGD